LRRHTPQKNGLATKTLANPRVEGLKVGILINDLAMMNGNLVA
jgi:hypothetical protein